VYKIALKRKSFEFEQWSIATSSSSIGDLLHGEWHNLKILDLGSAWFNRADPSFIDGELFYERFNYNTNGHIVRFDAKKNKEIVVYQSNNHVSFPTKYRNMFMVESSSVECISILDSYWNIYSKLKLSKPTYLDPILFQNEHGEFLFVSCHGATKHSDLYLYHRSGSDWRLVSDDPICSSQNGGRMAGTIIYDQQLGLLRVGQVSRPRYGSAIAVYKIEKISKHSYQEKFMGKIAPPDGFNGIHTINFYEGGLVLDLMAIKGISFRKIIQRLQAQLKP